ncbi:CBS domain-containing protein [Thermococcus siculi]|uniref:CBS domain-containing protein n=1 Tax=Thermococcus siculi TaxID=72803 RepID=A0A2Z2MKB8_9EURY|nr:CBS domain-containing protein [Thermococcus siculi]ASJ08248.1 CBS domain-containing protein [Thermococcus siculi]
MEEAKSEKAKAAKAKKIHIIHSKRKLLQLQRKEEMSHNIRYISKVPVRIVMDTDFLTLHPDDSLSKLVQNLRGEESSAVVVDEEGKLLGFITMKDLLHFFEPPRRYSIVGIGLLRKYSVNRTSRIEDIMVKKPVTIGIDDNLGRAIKIMLETGKHHLPVVDDENRVHGLLEIKDIIRLIRIVSA